MLISVTALIGPINFRASTANWRGGSDSIPLAALTIATGAPTGNSRMSVPAECEIACGLRKCRGMRAVAARSFPSNPTRLSPVAPVYSRPASARVNLPRVAESIGIMKMPRNCGARAPPISSA